MSTMFADYAVVRGLLSAQILMLLTPGANQLAICCASTVSLRAGLRAALVLAGVVAGLSATAALFGRAIAEQGWLMDRWAEAGILFLAVAGVRRLAHAWRGGPAGHDHSGGCLHVAATALSNPVSLLFYASVVVPLTGADEVAGPLWPAVAAMTVTAASVYGILAVGFSRPRVRAAIQGHRRVTDLIIGCCLILLAARLGVHQLP